MLIVAMTGGLGNQMFQYASGRALALQKNQRLILDFAGIEIDPNPTKFDIEVVKFKLSKDTWKISSIFVSRCVRGVLKFISLLPFCGNFYKIIRENDSSKFQPEIFEVESQNIFMNGTWQSFKYFKGIESELLCDFESTFPLSAESKMFLAQIKGSKSVSVHVRRGDSHTKTGVRNHKVFLFDEPSYYASAAKIIDEKLGSDVTYFIFSNDIPWARKHVLVGENVVYVDCNDGSRSFEDFILMASCQHSVIAASSFSWWAAWLTSNGDREERDRIVIAPSRWWYGISFNYPENLDHYPDDWVIIEC